MKRAHWFIISFVSLALCTWIVYQMYSPVSKGIQPVALNKKPFTAPKHAMKPEVQDATSTPNPEGKPPLQVSSDVKSSDEVDHTPDKAFEQDFLRTMDPAVGRPTPEVLPELMANNLRQMASQSLFASVPGSSLITGWKERGPKNVGGRTRAIAWDPNDPAGKKVWAGGVTGGLWYNPDITSPSSSWTPVNNFWSSLSITKIAFDPVNPKNIYVATGEGFFVGAGIGAGIWKSTDAGLNWSQLPSTDQFRYINDLVVRNENNQAVVYAAVDGSIMKGTFFGQNFAGLRRSADGGNSWTQVLPNITANVSYPYVAASLSIGQDNRLWVGTKASPFGLTDRGGGRVLFSDDGINWTISDRVVVGNSAGRVTVAAAPSSRNRIYAFVEDGGKLKALRKTIDGGSIWTDMLSRPDDLDNGIPPEDFTRGQAWYDQALAVSPLDSNSLLIGGIDLFRSRDGGDTWTQISKWSNNASLNTLNCSYVHADQHAIVYKPGDSSAVLFGTDGGVFYTPAITNAATQSVIAGRNNDYNVTQFYAGAIHPGVGTNFYLAGAQDNGTQRFNAADMNSTTEVTGGDGAFCFIDQTSPNTQVTSYVYNNFYRSLNGGNSFSSLISDGNTGMFINTACYDSYQHILYSYRSVGTGGGEFYVISNVNATPGASLLKVPTMSAAATALAVSPFWQNATALFIGTSNGKVLKVLNANTGSPTVTDISTGLPTGSISCIEFGRDENELLVTYFNYGINKIWYSNNGGVSWTNKMGNFPNIPVRWALFNPVRRDNEVILATELGVYATSDFAGASPSWTSSNTGFANVRTDMLQLRKSDYQVMAATHGRGVFTSNGFSEGNPPTVNAFTPIIGEKGITMTIKGSQFSAAFAVYIGGKKAQSFTVVNDSTITAVVGSGGTGYVSVATTGGEAMLSGFTFCAPPVITAPKQNLCTGDALFLSSTSGALYQWYRDGVPLKDSAFNSRVYPAKSGGTYTVKVSEQSGCELVSAPLVITESPKPAKPTITKDANGDLVSSSATGNQWYFGPSLLTGANGQKYTPVKTGDHLLKVTTDKGCTSPFSEPFGYYLCPRPVITSKATVICGMDSLTLNASSGLAFQWFREGVALSGATQKTFKTIAPGNYTVRVSDSTGCFANSASYMITALSKPTLTPSVSGICEGDSIRISTATVSGISYQWFRNKVTIQGAGSASIIAKTTGSYTVSVKDSSGCNVLSDSMQLTVYPIPPKPAITRDAGGNLLSSSLSGNQWYMENQLLTGFTANSYRPPVNGIITVRVTQNGCSSVFSDSYYYLTTSLLNPAAGNYFRAYPNPVMSALKIDFRVAGLSAVDMMVFDMQGKLLLRKQNQVNGTLIDLKTLPAGTYRLKVSDRRGVHLWSTYFVK